MNCVQYMIILQCTNKYTILKPTLQIIWALPNHFLHIFLQKENSIIIACLDRLSSNNKKGFCQKSDLCNNRFQYFYLWHHSFIVLWMSSWMQFQGGAKIGGEFLHSNILRKKYSKIFVSETNEPEKRGTNMEESQGSVDVKLWKP